MNRRNSKGQPEGYWESRWSNGRLNWRGYYSNGQRKGWCESYHSNGQLDFKGYYSNGQDHGFGEDRSRYEFYL